MAASMVNESCLLEEIRKTENHVSGQWAKVKNLVTFLFIMNESCIMASSNQQGSKCTNRWSYPVSKSRCHKFGHGQVAQSH